MIQVHKVDGGFVVSEDEVWVTGRYATEAGARRAVNMPPEVIDALQKRKNEEAGGAGGVITDADLVEAER